MSSRAITLALFAVIFLTALGVHLWGTRPGSPVPSAGRGLSWAMSTRTGRVVALLSWCWIGWHFFGR